MTGCASCASTEGIKIKCDICDQAFHPECLKNGRPTPIEGDNFFHLTCSKCNSSDEDQLTRMRLPWVTVVHLSLYNLQLHGNGKCGFFKWKESICTFIDRHWHNFFPSDKKKSPTWHGTIAGTLSIGSPHYFTSGSYLLGESGWWKLTDNKPPPIEQLNTPLKLPKGKSVYKEPKSFNVVNEHGRSSRARISSIQSAIELKARRDNTTENVSKRRRSSTIKKGAETYLGKSRASHINAHPEIPSSHLVSILLPLPLLPDTPRQSSEVCHAEKTEEQKIIVIKPQTLYSESVSSLLGDDKESDSEMEIDPCGIAGDDNALIVSSKTIDKDVPSVDTLSINQQWDEIMAPLCKDSAIEIKQEENEEVFIKEELSVNEELYGNPSTTASVMASLREGLIVAPNANEYVDQIVSGLTKYSKKEKNCAAIEPDAESRPCSSMGDYPSESEKEENISYDMNHHQSEVDLESEIDDSRSICSESTSTSGHKKRNKRKRKLKNEQKETKEKPKLIPLSVYEEKQILSQIQGKSCHKPEHRRFKRKLLLREMKRQHGLPCFNLDDMVNHTCAPDHLTPIIEPQISNCGQQAITSLQVEAKKVNILDRFQTCHSVKKKASGVSFLNKLIGTEDDQLQCIHSPYTSRLLKPFIRRDYETKPAKIKLLMEIQAYPHRNDPTWLCADHPPIDYCYVQPQHIPSVNALCREFFWPGIDLSECLEYPDFSCVVLYRKFVIGFAFMVPDVNHHEAYISFLFTHPEWRGAGIATFMIYHLIQTCMGKDITLHVSANNPAMLLYQKFGFKPEEFILDFYEKYFPAESKESRHAFYLRLRR